VCASTRTPGRTIGYVSIGSAEYEASQGTAIKLLPVGGIAATIENVGTGRFPLSRLLNLVLRTVPEGLAREYVDFAQSAEVHDLVRAHYFVPVAPPRSTRPMPYWS
jgi:phosphate transport system substrate-binding protein